VRIGGTRAASRPFQVDVQHPLTGDVVMSMDLGGGGIATSGLDRNLWRRADGSFAHHLLDPSTGEPAWTGLVGATATAPTALEAEAIAKSALLTGPDGARERLLEHGGLIVHDDGTAEHIAPTPISSVPSEEVAA